MLTEGFNAEHPSHIVLAVEMAKDGGFWGKNSSSMGNSQEFRVVKLISFDNLSNY
jgi:hypothetical protein